MRKTYLAAAASLGALMLASAPASAAITFQLNDVNFSRGGSLTGTFTTSDDLQTLESFSFTSTANDYGWFWGDFPGATYTNTDASSIIWNPEAIFGGLGAGLIATFSPLSSISLFFQGDLSATSDTPLLLSNETVIKWNGGTRSATSGSVSPLAAAVPEPATWAMMIGGLALVGFSMRRRKVAVSFA